MTENNDFSKSTRMKKFIRANKKNLIVLAIFLGILIILFSVIIGYAASDSDDYLTYENYEKIETDRTMTYEDVMEVLDNHIGTVVGGRGYVYTWQDSSGKRRISITVDENGFVYHKSQDGLD